MSELSKILGRPVAFDIEGVTIKMSRLNDTIRCNLQEWCERQLLANLAKGEGVGDVSADKHEIATALARGEYQFGKPKFLEFMNSADGGIEMCYQILLPNHPEITKDEVWGLLTQHAAVVGQKMKEIYEGDAKNQPPARTPAQEAITKDLRKKVG